MERNPGRHGRAWQRLRQSVIDESSGICAWCHQPVDRSLPGTVPDGPSVDHLVALIEGGHPTDRANLVLVHLRCNTAKEHDRRRKAKHNVSRRW